nr:MAG TPA: hypothetical protein [Caudoviricetes sp.]
MPNISFIVWFIVQMQNMVLESIRAAILCVNNTVATVVIIGENTTRETIILIMNILCAINIVEETKNHYDTMQPTENENR